jgi:hypothetical protein
MPPTKKDNEEERLARAGRILALRKLLAAPRGAQLSTQSKNIARRANGARKTR